MQVLSKTCQRVGRATWTLFGAVFYMLIAIPAVSNFNNTLEDFILIIAYWLGPWTIILIEEHVIFRRGRYNVEDWNTRAKLPVGWAALVSMGFGLLGIYLGAAQVLYVGPIAKLFNPPYGMDIGFELGLVFAGIAYFFLRRIELSINRR
jgi:purine-cytosine permease-like protein